MNQLSITRALVELKTLDKRIQKQIDSSVFISYKGQFYQPADGVKDAVANYQSINDLIERRKKIKSAIISSNAKTKVNLCGQEMTMAEAIETKSSIKHKKNLMAVLKKQFGDCNNYVETVNAKVRKDIESKSTREADKEKNQMSLEEFSKVYVNLHGIELFDPLKVHLKVEQLEKYITQFEQEVDYVLAEKNAITFIEV